MNNHRCCSYRLWKEKLERWVAVATAILRLILILLEIWTLIG